MARRGPDSDDRAARAGGTPSFNQFFFNPATGGLVAFANATPTSPPCFYIQGPSTGPIIATNPAPQWALPGDTTTFHAAATSDSPMTFQWLKNGLALQDTARIQGSRTTALTISNTGYPDRGTYVFAATDSCGESQSGGADLVMFCPADFNQDGGVDGQDIEAFFISWSAGDPFADVDRNGGVDGGDVEAFFIPWENGGC